jgi:hypothetical protein
LKWVFLSPKERYESAEKVFFRPLQKGNFREPE